MKNIAIFFTVGLGLFPMLKLNFFSIYMAVWFVIAIIYFIKNRKDVTAYSVSYKILLPLCILPILHVMYMPFAQDISAVFKMLNRLLPILIFAIGFYALQPILSPALFRKFSMLYIGSIIFLHLVGWYQLIQFGFEKAWRQNDFYHPIFRNIFADAAQMHIPYLGMLTAFGLFLMIYFFLKKSFLNQILIYSICAWLLFSMYLYSARMAIGTAIIGLIILAFYTVKNRIYRFAFIAAVFSSLFLIGKSVPLKDRYDIAYKPWFSLPKKGMQPHEVNYRSAIGYCSYQLLKTNWFGGVSAEHVQSKLNDCYAQFSYQSYEDFSQKTYNTHNQYIDIWLKYGILGLVAFLLGLYFFIDYKNVPYILFLFTITLAFITENILDRQMGVVFFSVFQSLFVIYNHRFPARKLL